MTRLTLAAEIDAGDWRVRLSQPILLQIGDYVWVDTASVHVRHTDGRVTVHDGDGIWLCRR